MSMAPSVRGAAKATPRHLAGRGEGGRHRVALVLLLAPEYAAGSSAAAVTVFSVAGRDPVIPVASRVGVLHPHHVRAAVA